MRAEGAISLNLLAILLFMLCSVVIVECFLKVVLGIHVLDVICDVRKKALLQSFGKY